MKRKSHKAKPDGSSKTVRRTGKDTPADAGAKRKRVRRAPKRGAKAPRGKPIFIPNPSERIWGLADRSSCFLTEAEFESRWGEAGLVERLRTSAGPELAYLAVFLLVCLLGDLDTRDCDDSRFNLYSENLQAVERDPVRRMRALRVLLWYFATTPFDTEENVPNANRRFLVSIMLRALRVILFKEVRIGLPDSHPEVRKLAELTLAYAVYGNFFGLAKARSHTLCSV